MPCKHLIEGPVILGPSECQHLIAVHRIPPRPRSFQTDMTHELVGGFAAPTAPRIAPTTAPALVGAAPRRIEVLPPVRPRLGRFVCRGLHAPEPTEHGTHWTHVSPRPGRFGPFQALQ